jgi:hypothetical protein
MTSYYKGNNIGLNYDAANAIWSFVNEPNDFIDPSSFSTADPAFDYTPPPSQDDDQEDTTCPPGYIYDETLKQCIPDPNVNQQAGYQQDTGGGQANPPVRIAGTSRTTTNGNFLASEEEYDAMSPAELLENYKQNGLVEKDDKGNLIVNLGSSKFMGSSFMDNFLGKVGGGGEAEARKKKFFRHMFNKQMIHSDLNPNLMNFYPGTKVVTADNFPMTLVTGENAKIVIPTKNDPLSNFVSGTTKTLFTAGFGDATYNDRKIVSRQPQFGDITSQFDKKVDSFKTATLNAIKVEGTGDASIAERIAAEERARKATFDADISEEKAKREMQKTIAEAEEREKIKKELEDLQAKKDKERKGIETEKDKRDMQETIRKAEKAQQVKEEYRDKGQVTYSSKDTGGYVTTPNKPSAPPGERGGGGYTKPTSYERPGTKGAPGYHW